MKLGRRPTPLTLKLLRSKCAVAKSGCWEVVGDIKQKYPRICHDGVCDKAHVAAFIVKTGRRPRSGFYVMHKCDNTRCAKPAHVVEGTSHDNRMDAVAKGRFGGWKLSVETRARQSLAVRIRHEAA